MAAVTGTVNSVRLLDYVGGQTKDSGNDKIASCIIFVSFAGTYATSDDGTIATVNTSIANQRRDGKTITLRDMAFHSAGLEGTTPIGILKGSTESSGTITCQLTDGTLAAEHGNAALGTFNRDIGIYCCYEIDE